MYDRDYAIQSTEFDIVEQGEVPILMSLPQVRNLRFHVDLDPDKVYLSSPVLQKTCGTLIKLEKHKKVSFFADGVHIEYGNIAKNKEALAVNDE